MPRKEIFGPLGWTMLALLGVLAAGAFMLTRLMKLRTPPVAIVTAGPSRPGDRPAAPPPHEPQASATHPMAVLPALGRPTAEPQSGVVTPVSFRVVLPEPQLPGGPRVLPDDLDHAVPVRATLDTALELPMLPAATLESLRLPAALPPRVILPAPRKVAPERIGVQRGPLLAKLDHDPSATLPNQPALRTTAPPRDKPAGALLLRIPDPQSPTAGHAQTIPPDDDPPVPAPGTPPRPKLPVK